MVRFPSWRARLLSRSDRLELHFLLDIPSTIGLGSGGKRRHFVTFSALRASMFSSNHTGTTRAKKASRTAVIRLRFVQEPYSYWQDGRSERKNGRKWLILRRF